MTIAGTATPDVEGPPLPPTGIGGNASSGSVSLIIVLKANLTASFSAFARMAASVPYVLSGGRTEIFSSAAAAAVVGFSFSTVAGLTSATLPTVVAAAAAVAGVELFT